MQESTEHGMVESAFNDRPYVSLGNLPEGGPHEWLGRACVVIPALDAEDSIEAVIRGVRSAIPEIASTIVVDDGSRDDTARVARDAGCTVVTSDGQPAHGDDRVVDGAVPPPPPTFAGGRAASRNRGKGAALRAGFEVARARGMSVALTLDADGQHPPEEARRVLFATPDEATLVLGVRDLVRAGAPRANQFSNGISNHFLSRFARRTLRDTQCGLRRYPIRETLALPTRGTGYDFEAEVILRAIWTGMAVIEEPVRVLYPETRRTHFRVGRDVPRIIQTVIASVGDHWLRPRARGEGA